MPAERPPDAPDYGDLDQARVAAMGCTRCPLHQNATQTVFGEGPGGADLLLVGEVPGDHEDRAGRPFVGPAGHLLDAALAEAGLARSAVYLTNAVKHFKWTTRPGRKRRIHQSPTAAEVGACRPWLEAELALVRPRAIVCLGTTAVRAVLGSSAPLKGLRGQPLLRAGVPVVVTVHPAAILRIPDPTARQFALALLVDELRTAGARARG
ncbi:MAG: UdgX family uracil-DNA binding protein [Candidatus Dormibacteria bacterium]